jgi:tetratricopeptide (TPR) repeat protein
MRYRILVSFLLFFFIYNQSFSEPTATLDSLKQMLLKTKDHREKANIHLAIAKLQKKYDSIRIYSERALENAQIADDTSLYGPIYKSIGVSFHMNNSLDSALIYYDSALMFLSKNADANTIARTYSNKSEIFIRYKSLDSAILNNEKCKEYSLHTDDVDLDRIYLKRKANILTLQGKNKESILVLKEMQKLPHINKRSIIHNYDDIGLNFFALGETDSAQYYYKLASKVNANEYPMDEIFILNNEANLFNFISDDENSIKCYLTAINIADSIKYPYGKALIGSNLANLYFNWGKYKEAIKIYQEHIPYLKDNGILKNLAINYANIGISFYSLDMGDSSMFYLKKAKNICLATDNQSLLSSTYHNLGRLYLSSNEYDSALIYFHKALEANTRENNINTKANIYHDMALAYSGLTEFSHAISLADSAQAIYQRVNNRKQSIETNLTMAKIYAAAGNYKKAYIKLDNFRNSNDSLFSKEKHKQITELETQYKMAQKETQIQRQLAKLADNELIIKSEKNKTLTYAIISAGATILVLLILIFFLRNRHKHLSIKNDLEQHKMELESRLLRSQMNPHFIFNSLNSIQSYITSKDQYHALIYLSKFAKLMRSILENSRHAFVSFEQDLSTLMIYTELESLRFEGQFKYQFSVDDDIDPENTYIPPMLVQPYIENAIIHGIIARKDNNGSLFIKFEFIENNHIKCSIEDNGIGREKAMKIKSNTLHPHKSLGMQVTKERMELISEMNKISFNEKIIDLKDKNKQALGTKVEIVIPYKENDNYTDSNS